MEGVEVVVHPQYLLWQGVRDNEILLNNHEIKWKNYGTGNEKNEKKILYDIE
jgi:hypothetical protein